MESRYSQTLSREPGSLDTEKVNEALRKTDMPTISSPG